MEIAAKNVLPVSSGNAELYGQVLARLEYQAGHAVVWRDAICNWFLRTSGIPDAKGRVGNYPDRVEAEAMQLKGYTPDRRDSVGERVRRKRD